MEKHDRPQEKTAEVEKSAKAATPPPTAYKRPCND